MACGRLLVTFAQDSKQKILHCCKHYSSGQRILEVGIGSPVLSRDSKSVKNARGTGHQRRFEPPVVCASLAASHAMNWRLRQTAPHLKLSDFGVVREVSENAWYRFEIHVKSGSVRRTKNASFPVKYRIKCGVFARAYINLWLVIGRPPKPKVAGSTPARDIYLKPCKQ